MTLSSIRDKDAIELQQPNGLDDPNSTSWNVQLTRLLRHTERYSWGNWTLDPTIQVGALGWFNPTDSQFQSAHSKLDKLAIDDDAAAVDWHLEQGEVKQSSVAVEFKVPYHDPSSGLTVNVGVENKWQFGTEGSISSNGSGTGTSFARDAAQVMLARYQEILKVAEANGKAKNGLIDQGFGMITKVWLTDGCVNVASRKDKAEFSITGSVDGVAAMTGKDESASLKGSYKSTSTSENVEKRVFPGKPDQVDTMPVAYAYEFSSFAGRVVIPRYVSDISALSLTLHNSGSYIVDAKVSYKVANEIKNREVRISGGLTGQITDIPLAATEVEIRMDFMAGATQILRVTNPLNSWYEGRGRIALTGWWPTGSGASWE
ncbi:MAG TPA: hypothetical protein VJV79_13545 [Polyangiaceae bacterium]|nr:hypothetical protein [Polyangiaceae bacterium]